MRKFALVALAGRNHCLDIVGCWEFDFFVGELAVPGEGIVGVGGGKFGNHSDISAVQLLDLGLLFALHGVDVGKFFGGAGNIVAQSLIALDGTVHDLEEGHFANERIGNRFEYENCRLAALGLDLHFFAAFQRFLFFGGVAREGFHNFIQQRPNAPEFCCGAAEHRNDLAGDNALMDGVDRLHVTDLLTLKILHHEVLVGACNGLHQHIAVFCNRLFALRRDDLDAMPSLIVKHVRRAVDQIDAPNDLAVFDHGDGERTNAFAEGIVQGIQHASETRFVIVKFIDEERARQFCLGGKIPGDLGSNLDAGFAVHRDDGAVRHADCLQNFACKIQIPGGVQQVDFDVLPGHVHEGRGNRNFSCDLLGVVIADGVPGSNIPQPVYFTGQIKHCLRKGGLSAPAVTKERDVSDVFRFNFCHGVALDNPFHCVRYAFGIYFSIS